MTVLCNNIFIPLLKQVGIHTFLNLVFVELLDGAKMVLVLLAAKDDIADVILNSLKEILAIFLFKTSLELEVILIFKILTTKQYKRRSRNLESCITQNTKEYTQVRCCLHICAYIKNVTRQRHYFPTSNICIGGHSQTT